MTDSKTSHSATGILADEERRQQFIESGWWVSIPLTTFSAHWLNDSDQRLDASYYSDEISTALRILRDSPYPFKCLSVRGQDIANTFGDPA